MANEEILRQGKWKLTLLGWENDCNMCCHECAKDCKEDCDNTFIDNRVCEGCIHND